MVEISATTKGRCCTVGRMNKILVTGMLLLGIAANGFDLALADPAPRIPPAPENPIDILTRLFAPHLLEKKSTSSPELRYCGVEITDLVKSTWSRMTPELQQHIPDQFRPPRFRDQGAKSAQGRDVCDAFLDSAHFRIHYSTDPEHLPPGFPDLQVVRDLASHLETAYEFHRDVSGMGVALPDGDHGGGQDLFDCYFYKLAGGLFGYAHGFQSVETDCENTYMGYFAVTTDFNTRELSDQLRLTSEHEYYHLLQYAHNSSQYTWFKESTARNSEFHVWPDIAVPLGVWAWMTHPYYSLWDGSGFHKYAPHFWFYLEAHHGWDFVTRIWDRCCRSGVETALVAELDDLGSDLGTTLTDFAVWNYFTGVRDDGDHYDPAYNLPAVYHQASHSDYPLLPVSLRDGLTARPAASNYIRFDGPASNNNLRLTFDGHPAMAGERAVIVLGVNEWGHRSWILKPDPEGDVELIVPDWGLFDYVTLVVVNFWNAPGDSTSLHYTYAAAEVDQATEVTDLARLVMSSPNPFGNSTRVVYYIPREGSTSTIRVYDPAGRLVRTLLDESVFAGLHQVVWDGRDQQGRPAAAGMYLIRLENGPHQHTRKVTFVR